MKLVSGPDSYPMGEHIEATAVEIKRLEAFRDNPDDAGIEELVGPEIEAAVRRYVESWSVSPLRIGYVPGIPVYQEGQCRCKAAKVKAVEWKEVQQSLL